MSVLVDCIIGYRMQYIVQLVNSYFDAHFDVLSGIRPCVLLQLHLFLCKLFK